MSYPDFVRPLLVWSLIAWNRITEWWDSACEFLVKSIRALEHAHKRDYYMFIDRNQFPIHVKEDELDDFAIPPYVFCEETSLFSIYNHPYEDNVRNVFHVVSVELIEVNRIRDISSFFHRLSWKGLFAPSLFEVVLLYQKLNKEYLKRDRILEKKLRVMDDNGDIHMIPLSSPIAKRVFTGWT